MYLYNKIMLNVKKEMAVFIQNIIYNKKNTNKLHKNCLYAELTSFGSKSKIMF